MALGLTSLLDALGSDLAGYDYAENRARTNNAASLRAIAASGLKRRQSLADTMASNGMIHSGVNLTAQADLGSMLDEQRNTVNQSLNDRLANIARSRINDEYGFKINSLLPR